MPNGSAASTSRRALRYRVTLWLRRVGRPQTIRWELAHGRVTRPRRGVYATGRLDRRTAWWMQRQLDAWDFVERVSESS
jgi:hypothetical protein